MTENESPPNLLSLLLSPTVFPVLLAALVYTAVKLLDQTDVPYIKNLPSIPGYPIFGNLTQLGENHALVAKSWVAKYGPVFQVRLGNRRVVFGNSFQAIRELWITQQSALIDRPKLHTFHTVVSSSEGFTIGTSPWDASCKARRKAAATALNRPAVASYMPIIDYECNKSLKEMLQDSKWGEVDVDPVAYFTRFALSTSLTLNYGIPIEGNVNDELLKEITRVEREISHLRSTSNNWADYVPLLRLKPGGTTKALEFKKRRADYMYRLLYMLKDRMAQGTDKPCITGSVLRDPEAKLSDVEVLSIGLSMVSAGLDTIPGNLIMCIAYLGCGERGREIQQRALDEINSVYPDNDSWEKCLHEEKCPYVSALVKETLRFWTVIPISLPRVSVKDVKWGEATIPAGTSFYMNAYAAHYDDTHFKDAYEFRPERYLLDNTIDDGAATRGTPHYSYGAGSRMCIGSHLANRELYTAFLRMITAFEILPPKLPSDRPILDALQCNASPTSLTMDPKPFKVGLKVRDRAAVERWVAESEARTSGM